MRDNILHIIYSIAVLLVAMMLENCASHKKNVFSKIYHNTTARYNAYFIALEQMTEVELAIEEAHDRDYDRVLMVFPDIDSAIIDSNTEKLEDCIKKASIAIQRHENSSWVDDSYLIIGKSWLYQAEFTNAIETLKYVYTQSEEDDTRHRALVVLMRTYIHYNEHNNAIAAGDVLLKEGPNEENLRDYHLTKAYLYQLRKDFDRMRAHLSEAVALEKDRKSLALYHFILGQLCQRSGQEEEAYRHYRKSLRSNPDYELSFYTKLNLAQVTGVDNSADAKKIRNYFRKLLKDDKNIEFRDRIYFEMARFELKRQNYEQAIDHLKASVRESQGNQRQKAYSYLKLAELYYDHYKNYKLAQAYYDSTVNVLPTDNERYEEIQERQQILNNFVRQINTIHDQDSLLQLAGLPEDELHALLTGVVEARELARIEQEKALRKEERRSTLVQGPANRTTSNPFSAGTEPGTQGAQWYFYNQVAVSSGISAFQNRWGNRPLEDNWRRSTKESMAQFEEVETAPTGTDTTERVPSQREAFNPEEQVASLMATVPFSEEEQQAALVKIETAYYNLSKIYRHDLQEIENAVETFETLLERFPESEYEPEVLYQLTLIFREKDPAMAQKYKEMLVLHHPETIYASLAENPNYLQESRENSERLEQLYKIAYGYYERGDYDQSSMLVSSALERYPDNAFSDHLRLLDILVKGKVEGQFQYQYALQEFIENHPESLLLEYARTLLEKSRNFEVSQAKRAGAKFTERLDYPHLFVIVYNSDEETSAKLPALMDAYIDEQHAGQQLNVGNLVFNNEQSILIVNQFEAREDAEQFINTYGKENPVRTYLGDKAVSRFIITEDNFRLFYQSKLLEDYLSFYQKHYQ